MYEDQYGEFICGHWGLKGYDQCLNQVSWVVMYQSSPYHN